MIFKIILSLFLAVLLFVSGCRTTAEIQKGQSKVSSAESPIHPSGEIPLSLEVKGALSFISLLKERAEKIHSFRAPIILSVSGKDFPKYEKLSGVLMASDPGKYRIIAYSSNNVVVLDFLSLPGITKLRWASPGDNNLKFEAEAGKRPYPGFMENLSLVMGSGPFPKPGISLINRSTKGLSLYVLDQNKPDGVIARKRKIWLNGNEVLITKIEELGFNKLLGSFEMKDYRQVESHWIPHDISLSFLDFFSMEINLKSISLNESLDDKLFDPKSLPN